MVSAFSTVRMAYHMIYHIINHMNFYLNRVKIGKGSQVNGFIFIRNLGKIQIGSCFKVNSGRNKNPIGGDSITRIIVGKRGFLSIGNNVGISNTTICCETRIIIDDYVYIGGGCKIWDTDFHSLNPNERVYKGDREISSKPVFIGKYAFIGGSVIILKGVSIGENSIIAAGSVVTKNVPKNEIWGGNPARFIKNVF